MPEDSELIETVNAANLKKPGYIILKTQCCKIVELNMKPKATVKGNDRLHIVGTSITTGKKYEDTINLTAGKDCWVQVPIWTKKDFVVLDADKMNKSVSVLRDENTGETGEVVLPVNEDETLTDTSRAICEKFDTCESEFKVSVLSIMGKEIVLDLA